MVTPAGRNSALLEQSAVILPNGVVDAADRETLVGDYKTIAAPSPGSGGDLQTHIMNPLGPFK